MHLLSTKSHAAHHWSSEPGPTVEHCRQPFPCLSYQGHGLATASHMQLTNHCAGQGPPAAHASRLAEHRRALPAAFFTTFLKRLPHAMGSSAGRFSSVGSCAHDERASASIPDSIFLQLYTCISAISIVQHWTEIFRRMHAGGRWFYWLMTNITIPKTSFCT